MATKKSSNSKKATLRRPTVKTSVAEQTQTIAELRQQLAESLQREKATATDVQPVLDAIVESAARVCGIDDIVLRLQQGNTMAVRAHFGPIPIPIGHFEIDKDEPHYRWMHEHGTLHVPDVRAQDDFPILGSAGAWRTFLIVPLRQQAELVGVLGARRI